MKRIFVFAVLCLGALAATAQIHYEEAYATHPDQLYVSGTLNDDSVHIGNWTWWHPNGQVFRQGKYDNQGRKTGVWRTFYNDGRKHEEMVMSGSGTSRTWYASGKPQSEVSVVDGKKEGMFVSWYENGQKKDEVPYVDGVREGKTREWHENGQLKFEGVYVDDELEGQATWWTATGKKDQEGRLVQGEQEGEWVFYWRTNGNVGLLLRDRREMA